MGRWDNQGLLCLEARSTRSRLRAFCRSGQFHHPHPISSSLNHSRFQPLPSFTPLPYTFYASAPTSAFLEDSPRSLAAPKTHQRHQATGLPNPRSGNGPQPQWYAEDLQTVQYTLTFCRLLKRKHLSNDERTTNSRSQRPPSAAGQKELLSRRRPPSLPFP